MTKRIRIFPGGKAMNEPKPIFQDNTHGNNLVLQVVEKISRREFGHLEYPSLECVATPSKGGEGNGVKSFPHRRGYAGRPLIDCIRHDDYRSPAFTGPMVAA